MKHCRICCEPLEEKSLYHTSCCKALFGQALPPELPFAWSELNDLAERIVQRSVSVAGV